MLVAPRAHMGLEGLTNEHENPIGSQATYLAAKTIYEWFKVCALLGLIAALDVTVP